MFSFNSCSLGSVYFYTISVVQGYQNFLPMVFFLDDLSVWFLSHRCRQSLAEKPSTRNALKWERVCKKRDSYLSSCKGVEMHCFDLLACKNCKGCKLKVAFSKWSEFLLDFPTDVLNSDLQVFFLLFLVRAVFCFQEVTLMFEEKKKKKIMQRKVSRLWVIQSIYI